MEGSKAVDARSFFRLARCLPHTSIGANHHFPRRHLEQPLPPRPGRSITVAAAPGHADSAGSTPCHAAAGSRSRGVQGEKPRSGVGNGVGSASLLCGSHLR